MLHVRPTVSFAISCVWTLWWVLNAPTAGNMGVASRLASVDRSERLYPLCGPHFKGSRNLHESYKFKKLREPMRSSAFCSFSAVLLLMYSKNAAKWLPVFCPLEIYRFHAAT